MLVVLLFIFHTNIIASECYCIHIEFASTIRLPASWNTPTIFFGSQYYNIMINNFTSLYRIDTNQCDYKWYLVSSSMPLTCCSTNGRNNIEPSVIGVLGKTPLSLLSQPLHGFFTLRINNWTPSFTLFPIET
jgi:hypothetical protein